MPASHDEVELIPEKSIAARDEHKRNDDEPCNHQHTGRQPRQRRDGRPGAFRCRDRGHAVHLNLAWSDSDSRDRRYRGGVAIALSEDLSLSCAWNGLFCLASTTASGAGVKRNARTETPNPAPPQS
jgi:hypothetical protein